MVFKFLAIFSLCLISIKANGFMQNPNRMQIRPDLRHPGLAFNDSNVIVWEKCGVSARTKISPIFKSNLIDDKKLSLFYNPSINSLVFETESPESPLNTSVVKIPENDINTLFLSFKDPNKLQIYVDCPSTTKHKLSWDSDSFSKMKSLELYTNAEAFENMQKALDIFQCRSVVNVNPGSVVRFNGLLQSARPPSFTTSTLVPNLPDSQDPTLIYSFNNDGILYSFNYLNGKFQVISSNGSEILINSTRPVPPNGFYLVFSNNGLHIYDKCPHRNAQIGFWPTDMFKNKFKIETSRVYSSGNVASDQLLESYCAINDMLSLNESISADTCLNVDQVQSQLKMVQNSFKFSSLFLPSTEQMQKLLLLKEVENFDLPYTVSSEHRILFASRHNAPTRFFNRPMMDYVQGFSDGQNNYWIGLDTLNQLTNQQSFGLKLEIKVGQIFYTEEYAEFRVLNSTDGYKILVDGLKTPSFINFWQHNNTEFSALDFGENSFVARKLLGGFWHKLFALNTENYYCFSCETGDDLSGSYYDNPEGNFKEVRITNMYLTV
ncbi:microfibril-associated glyco 4-like precursor [Brachionus plicatilis]|uniref:Microfibril-associated glyco 4-like n=1 Tax=Brachionus plicatilis TaxID=10195 RepID=A0A3M7P2E0_BRAPC|nr:microfibril-associated glyco 4-like precursor [Brachionus plicatilis]